MSFELNEITSIFPPNKADPTVVGPLNTLEHVRQGLGLLGLSAPEQLPKKWNWDDIIKLLPPSNQASCGDCWAHSSTNALTDKFLCLKGLKGLELNQLLTTICTFHTYGGMKVNNECGGGIPYVAGKYFEEKGAEPITETENCPPSWEKFCSVTNCRKTPIQLPSCNNYAKCSEPYRAVKGSSTTLTVKDSKGNIDPQSTVNNIKQAIMNTGPVVASFFVFADFEFGNVSLKSKGGWDYHWNATDGVYVNGKYDSDLDKLWNESSERVKKLLPKPAQGWSKTHLGAHAVEVVGWDENGKYPCWIVKNSWGGKWNGNGYWKHGMFPMNRECALDVSLVFSGLNASGGCTNFKADLSTGGVKGSVVGKANSGGDRKNAPSPSSSSKGKGICWLGYVTILVVSIIIIILVAFLF